MWGQSFFMPNFDWLLQCVKDKMDVSQDFTDSPRILSDSIFVDSAGSSSKTDLGFNRKLFLLKHMY